MDYTILINAGSGELYTNCWNWLRCEVPWYPEDGLSCCVAQIIWIEWKLVLLISPIIIYPSSSNTKVDWLFSFNELVETDSRCSLYEGKTGHMPTNLHGRVITVIANFQGTTHKNLRYTGTKATNDHWLHGQLDLLCNLIDNLGPPSKHYPSRTMLNFHTSLLMVSTVLNPAQNGLIAVNYHYTFFYTHNAYTGLPQKLLNKIPRVSPEISAKKQIKFPEFPWGLRDEIMYRAGKRLFI